MPKRGPSLKNTKLGAETLGTATPFLREVVRKPGGDDRAFPFSVPVIRTLERLSFPGAVTFFVGENGSGKSTLLEGIALAAKLPAVGSSDLGDDATLGAQRAMRAEFQQRLADLEVEYADRSAWAKQLAMGPARASLAALESRYGVDLDANSHGQSFLRLFQSRSCRAGSICWMSRRRH